MFTHRDNIDVNKANKCNKVVLLMGYKGDLLLGNKEVLLDLCSASLPMLMVVAGAERVGLQQRTGAQQVLLDRHQRHRA